MSRFRYTRRNTIRALGSAALFAPFWRVLRGEAQAAIPKRLLLVFSPNGTITDDFFPSGGERDFRFNRILAPLEPMRDKVLVLRGVDEKIGGPSDAHKKGIGQLWTGQELRNDSATGFPKGMSVDQRVADEIGGSTRFKSLELALGLYDASHIYNRMIYRGNGEPVPPETNPQRAFDRAFDGFTAPTGTPGPASDFRQRVRQSVLDRSFDELTELRGQLGREDAHRLEFHADSLRDLETRLATTPIAPIGSGCALPERAAGGLDLSRNRVDPIAVSHMADIATMAFACDLTRVASIMWSRGASATQYPELGVNESHHSLAHRSNTGATRDKLSAIQEWYAGHFLQLLQRLDAIPEGDGTLLDNTLVVWGNELRDGERHRRDSMPFVLAGGAGGAIEMGRYLRFNGASHTDLLTSIVHAFGIREDFGDSRYTSGPLI